MGSMEGAPGIGCLQLTLEMHLRFFQQHSTHNTSTHNNLSTNNTVPTNNTLAFLQPFREYHKRSVTLDLWTCYNKFSGFFLWNFILSYISPWMEAPHIGLCLRSLTGRPDCFTFLVALIVSLFTEVVILVGQMGGS